MRIVVRKSFVEEYYFDRKNLQDYANRMNKTKNLYVWVEGDDKADRIK